MSTVNNNPNDPSYLYAEGQPSTPTEVRPAQVNPTQQVDAPLGPVVPGDDFATARPRGPSPHVLSTPPPIPTDVPKQNPAALDDAGKRMMLVADILILLAEGRKVDRDYRRDHTKAQAGFHEEAGRRNLHSSGGSAHASGDEQAPPAFYDPNSALPPSTASTASTASIASTASPSTPSGGTQATESSPSSPWKDSDLASKVSERSEKLTKDLNACGGKGNEARTELAHKLNELGIKGKDVDWMVKTMKKNEGGEAQTVGMAIATLLETHDPKGKEELKKAIAAMRTADGMREGTGPVAMQAEKDYNAQIKKISNLGAASILQTGADATQGSAQPGWKAFEFGKA
ncbi:MAG TPA: hypothetical protein VFH51_13570 [Myxococcota bacterium]|nr:hypothetical protein [Myxococcota bacterium]